VAVLTDSNGSVWSVYRDWWPFPGDFDFTDLFELAIALLFVVLWPFWLLGKFLVCVGPSSSNATGTRWDVNGSAAGANPNVESTNS
jgi:hypothetical protein